MTCPACGREIVELTEGPSVSTSSNLGRGIKFTGEKSTRLVVPFASSRPPCPPDAPPAIQQDYNEACQILSLSPKASAALARRALQHILRDAGKFNGKTLYDEIEMAQSDKTIPDGLREQLHAVREIGNWAAHPELHDGSIIADVEPDEAEWTLDVVESLVDHYFVAPAKRKAKLDKLKQKQEGVKAAKTVDSN